MRGRAPIAWPACVMRETTMGIARGTLMPTGLCVKTMVISALASGHSKATTRASDASRFAPSVGGSTCVGASAAGASPSNRN